MPAESIPWDPHIDSGDSTPENFAVDRPSAERPPQEDLATAGNNATIFLKLQRKMLEVKFVKQSVGDGMAPNKSDVRAEFGRFGRMETVEDWKAGTVMIYFTKSRSVTKVLENTVLKAKDQADGFRPNKWYTFGLDEAARFRVKYMVDRSSEEEEEEEELELDPLHESFDEARGDSETLDVNQFLKAIKAHCESEGSEIPKDADLKQAFKDADRDRSGNIDFEEFKRLNEMVQKGEVKGIGKGWAITRSISLSPWAMRRNT